jgi:ankyrin repeat protein
VSRPTNERLPDSDRSVTDEEMPDVRRRGPTRNWLLPVAILAVIVIAGALVWLLASQGGDGDDVAESAAEDETLMQAVDDGDVALAETLLEAGADPDEPRVNGLTPLMRASGRDDREMVVVLLDAGADLGATDIGGLSAWDIAAQLDAAESLDALIAAGADPSQRASGGMNALDRAAAWGSVDVLERLADAGMDVNARSKATTSSHGFPRDEGTTPLGFAVRSGRPEAIDVLLGLGADVNESSTAGLTPLLIAVFERQSPEIVETLLDAGADPTVTLGCDQGCSVDGALTPLEWAQELGRDDLIPVLTAATSS